METFLQTSPEGFVFFRRPPVFDFCFVFVFGFVFLFYYTINSLNYMSTALVHTVFTSSVQSVTTSLFLIGTILLPFNDHLTDLFFQCARY